MAENGEEKLIAAARHIAKTLGNTDNNATADEILQIFSKFDGRLRDKLPHSHSHDSDNSLKSLDRHVSRFLTSDLPIFSSSSDSSTFLDSIDQLTSVIRNEKYPSPSLDRAEYLLQQSMFRLEDEFKLLIERGGESFDLTRFKNPDSTLPSYSSDSEDLDNNEEDDDDIPVAHPISDYNIIIDALPSGTINDLQEIVKRMVAGGCAKECSRVYGACRREFLEESLSRLGLQKLSLDEEVQKMQWTDLEDEIDRWIKAVNVAVRILFPSERRLCDRVFFGFSSTADVSFTEVCRGSMTQLLSFAHAVAVGSRAPERLFKVLDMFETVRDLMPELEEVFSDQYSVRLTNDAITISKRLGESIRGIFMELENLIRRDPVKTGVPGGGLHPITRYVMNYLLAACRSRQTLEQVFEEGVVDYRMMEDRSVSAASLLDQMSWVMELLESNLEAKAKIYRDTALCSVFMMNNGSYIVQKVRGSDLGSLFGEDWVRKQAAKVRQYQVNYQRSSWSKVLGVLKVDSNPLKEKLKSFNKYFEEICATQSKWVIFDEQLREDLRSSVVGNLVPAYRSFIARLQSAPEMGKQADRYVNYHVEDIESHINELFRGSGGSAGGRK